MKQWWRVPFSIAACTAFVSVGAHLLDRSNHVHDDWTQFSYWSLSSLFGLAAVMEALQVWRVLGLGVKEDNAERRPEDPDGPNSNPISAIGRPLRGLAGYIRGAGETP